MSKKEQRPEAHQANSRMEKGAWSTKGMLVEVAPVARKRERQTGGRRVQKGLRIKREPETGDSSGELCVLRKVVQCLSRTKGLCSLGMMNWHCSRILERVEGCRTCKLVFVHNLGKLLSFCTPSFKHLNSVKFRHSIPFILAQLKSLNYPCLFNLLTGTLLPALLKHEVAKKLLYKQTPAEVKAYPGAGCRGSLVGRAAELPPSVTALQHPLPLSLLESWCNTCSSQICWEVLRACWISTGEHILLVPFTQYCELSPLAQMLPSCNKCC